MLYLLLLIIMKPAARMIAFIVFWAIVIWFWGIVRSHTVMAVSGMGVTILGWITLFWMTLVFEVPSLPEDEEMKPETLPWVPEGSDWRWP